MRRGSLVQLLLIAAAAGAISTAVAVFVPWMPTSASKEFDRINFTFWFATWISLFVFAVVAAVLIFAALKFRVADDDLSDGPPVHGHTMLEIVWTIIPTILVTAIGVVSAVVLAQNSDVGDNPLVVEVTAQQFAWEFTYANEKTYGQLRLPIDRKVELQITANDVIHSFWVPQFAQKQDAVPGEVYPLVITPTRVGTFPVICTELCGLGHSLMRSEAIVLSQDDYDAWFAGESQPGGGGGGGGENAARTQFNQLCAACHTFAPAQAAGTIGPSLDNLSEAAAAAGEPLEEFIRTSIVEPDAYVDPEYLPGTMPPFGEQLPAEEIDALVQYLAANTK